MSGYNYTYRYGNVKRYSKQSNKETPTFAEEVMLLLESNGITSGQSFETSIYLGRNIYLKLKKDKNYIPSENAAYTICIALKLSLYETMNLLNKAGFLCSLFHRSFFLSCTCSSCSFCCLFSGHLIPPKINHNIP